MPLNLPKPSDTYDNTWANQYTATLELEDRLVWSAIQTLRGLVTPFTGDPTGVADSGPAINAAFAAGLSVVSLGTGTYKITTAVSIPAGKWLDVGRANINLGAPITLGDWSALTSSLPAAMRPDITRNYGRIKQIAGTNLSHMIIGAGAYLRINNVLIDGDKANNATSDAAVYISASDRPTITFTSVIYSASHGIHVYAAGTDNNSTAGKILDVFSWKNDGAGLRLEGVADWFINQSEFEENGTAAVELYNAPTARISNSDLSGGDYGLWVHGAGYNPGVSLGSNNQIVSGGNQFGNNTKNDIFFDGTNYGTFGNQVIGNTFFPSSFRPYGTYAQIRIEDNANGGNNIVGNMFYVVVGFGEPTYGVEIYESAPALEAWDCVSSNSFFGVFVTAPFVGTGKTAFLGNDEYPGVRRMLGLTSVGINILAPVLSLEVQAAAQFDGLALRSTLGVAIASLVGTNADADNGQLTLNQGGVINVLLSAGNGSYFQYKGVTIGDNTQDAPPGALQLVGQLFGSLPAASATYLGSVATVTDSTTNVWGAVITGGGGNKVIAFCNGTDWTVAAK